MKKLLRHFVCNLDSRSKAKERNSGHIMDGVSGAGQVSLFGVDAGFMDRAEAVGGSVSAAEGGAG
jgi:hypothetical protein